jgi:NhaP-type Na+/H+ or K+/H+ antiporter
LKTELWFTVAGVLLLVAGVAGSYVKRLPLSSAMLYLVAGFLLGPYGAGVLSLDAEKHAGTLERLTEVAVIVSLFTAGLKLRTPLKHRRWRPAFRLASVSMMLTVGLIAASGVWLLGLSLGAAVLLGAVLAPTDPVLASDVQVEDAKDANDLRFSLTGEAGFNDGTAFPFVMLALGMLGLHDVGEWGWRWFAVDVVWSIAGGLAIGTLLGTGLARGVLHLRREHKEAVGLDDFLALGLIALSYGLSLQAHTYGFLAVFAAGLAMRRVEMSDPASDEPEVSEGIPKEELATHREQAPAYLAHALLQFNEQVERIAELTVVVVIGALFQPGVFASPAVLLFLLVLFAGIRPLAVYMGLTRSGLPESERRLMAWFGIRGIGSLYYLCYAISHGLDSGLTVSLTGVTLATIVASSFLHGISVTPLMNRYRRIAS